eukprot:2619359-Prymnesium_polylepis.1
MQPCIDAPRTSTGRGPPQSARRVRLCVTAPPHGPSCERRRGAPARGRACGGSVRVTGVERLPVRPALACWRGCVRYGPERSRIDVTRPVRRNAARFFIYIFMRPIFSRGEEEFRMT